MANEISVIINSEGELPGCVVATGSVVAGNFVEAYQTATDDMFAAAQATAFTTGSVAIVDSPSTGATAEKIIGIAAMDAGSGQFTSVYTEGVFIGVSAGNVTAGEKIMAEGNSGIIDFNDDASGAGYVIGRAFTGASTADKYVLFKINL